MSVDHREFCRREVLSAQPRIFRMLEIGHGLQDIHAMLIWERRIAGSVPYREFHRHAHHLRNDVRQHLLRKRKYVPLYLLGEDEDIPEKVEARARAEMARSRTWFRGEAAGAEGCP